MPAPAFFFPRAQGANPQHFANAGLPPDFAERAEFADVLDSPTLGRGIIAAYPQTGGTFRPADYDWHPAKADESRGLAAERFYIGLPLVAGKNGGVKPKDLARQEPIGGPMIELSDGNVWRIASIANLPRNYGLDDTGRFAATVKAEYREIVKAADAYAVQFCQALDCLEQLQAAKPHIDPGETIEFTLSDAAAFACDVLALNYRLCPELVDALGLLRDELSILNIVKGAIGLTDLLQGKQPDEGTLEIAVH